MKRILVALLGMALVAGLAVMSFATTGADFVTFNITVIVTDQVSGLAVVSQPVSYGGLGINKDVISNGPQTANGPVGGYVGDGQPRAVVANVGSATVPAIQPFISGVGTTQTANAGAWTFNTAAYTPAQDQAVLAGVFTIFTDNVAAGGRVLAPADFGLTDIIPTAQGPAASNTVFAVDSENVPLLKGTNIAAGDQRSMRFRLMTPATVVSSKFISQAIALVMYDGE